MSIWRGAQSAAFWYLSCAPCAEASLRKKRKQDIKQSRLERERLEAEMPGVYRQATPSSTNPHWQTEIDAGPVLVARGRKKATTGASDSGGRKPGLKTSMTQRSDNSNRPSSVDVSSIGGSRDGRVDSKVHFQQYQREDEEPPLGFISMERLGSSSTLGATSQASRITRPARAHTIDSSYASPRNPQVNDLHPAIATHIGSKEEARWLLQPPPTAGFMSGKDLGSRSRSDSGGSSRMSARSAVPLSRDVTQRVMERKIRSDLSLTPTMSRDSTVTSQGHRRDRSNTDEIDFAFEDSTSIKPKKRSASFHVQESEDSTDTADTVIHSPDLAPEPIRTQRLATKPQLSTIASESAIASTSSSEARKENRSSRQSESSIPERDRNARRPALLVKDDSLKVLQDLAPHTAIFKARVVSSQDLSKAAARQSSLPPQDANEERDLEAGVEFFDDTWHSADLTSLDWIHEHTKREVTERRWSMDI